MTSLLKHRLEEVGLVANSSTMIGSLIMCTKIASLIDPPMALSNFCRRFRMRRELFFCTVEVIAIHDPWFLQRKDALERLGLFMLLKRPTTIHMLAYGLPADACHDYYRFGKSTAFECMKRFVVVI